MLPGFPSLLARTAFASSASFSPLASRAVPRHGSPSFPPSPRFISIVDSKPIIPILSEAEQRSEQERAKLDPDVTRRREAILKEVKRAEEAKGNSGEVRLSFTVLGEEGVVKHPHLAYTKAEICSSWSLHPRDVRPLDSNNSTSPFVYQGRQNLVATILPRRSSPSPPLSSDPTSGSIIFNLLYIRALIRKDEVLLLDSAEGLDSGLHRVFRDGLVRHLQEKGNADEPFSFRVLDSLLLSSAITLEAEMTLLRGTVLALLSDLEKEISREGLKRLLSVSKDLSGLGERVSLVNDAVERCLVDDDIISLMDLSQPPVDRTAKGGLEDIELLLESFSQRVEEVISEVQTTEANVNSTQEIVELMLNTSRNALLVLDIKVSLLSLGIGAGTLVAGVFGMNLTSGWEEAPQVFYYATGGLLAFAGIVTALGLRKLAILRRVGLGVQRGKGRDGHGLGMGGTGGSGGGEVEAGKWFGSWRRLMEIGGKKGDAGVL